MKKMVVTLLVSSALLGACQTPDTLKPPLIYVHPAQVTEVAAPTKVTNEQVAHISLTAVNVIRWSEITSDLQKVQFSLTPDQLVEQAVHQTSAVTSLRTDVLAAKLAAVLTGTKVDQTITDTIAGDGTTKGGSISRAIKTPDIPTGLPTAIDLPALVSTPLNGQNAVDGQTKYRAAAALAEALAVINHRVTGVPIQAGYVPYFLNILASVQPKDRGFPYDVTISLKIVPAEPAKIVGSAQDIYLLPLLVTDSFDVAREQDIEEIARQLAAQASGNAGFFGGSAGVSRTVGATTSSDAIRPNSLYSIAQDGRSGVRVRLGANRVGDEFEMVPQAHNLSLVMLVPKGAVTPNGVDLAIQGSAVFSDAMSGRHREQPYPRLEQPIALSNFPMPTRPAARCPSAQDLVLIPGKQTGDDGSVSIAAVRIDGGDALEDRAIEARLKTPVILAGAPLTLSTRQVSTTSSGLQFVFPGHLPAVKLKDGAPALGSLTFRVLRDSVEPEMSCPATAAYRVAYLPPEKEEKPAAAAAKPAKNAAYAKDQKPAAGDKPTVPAAPAAGAATTPAATDDKAKGLVLNQAGARVTIPQ